MALNQLKTAIKGVFPILVMYYAWKDRNFFKHSINRLQRDFYNQFISREDLVFDVGANIGQRSKIYISMAKKVIAFEPQPYCIKHLRARFLNAANFTLRKIGLSEKPGHAKMFVSSSHTLSTLSESYTQKAGKRIFKGENWNKEIVIETAPLEAEIKRFGIPSFIKIDVEGFELEVLKGLETAVKGLSFEFIPSEEVAWRLCLERIQEISPNYRYNYTLGEELTFQLDEHVDYETIMKNPQLPKEKSFGDIYAFLPIDEDTST